MGLTARFASLDVRRFQRLGLLRPGTSFLEDCIQDGQRAGSIKVTAEEDRIILSYAHLCTGAEWQIEEYPAQLEWVSCNFGGRRAWLHCPMPDCGRRVAILYGNGLFACRHCHKLVYFSQRISASRRALRRAQAIRERLGGTANMYDPFPVKPKGKHWQTYLELRRLYDDANEHSWPGWLRRWKGPSRVEA